MQTVPQTPRTFQPVAYNATLFAANVGTSGTALRTADGHVYFLTTATGVWTELFDADIPNLHLHGRADFTDRSIRRSAQAA